MYLIVSHLEKPWLLWLRTPTTDDSFIMASSGRRGNLVIAPVSAKQAGGGSRNWPGIGPELARKWPGNSPECAGNWPGMSPRLDWNRPTQTHRPVILIPLPAAGFGRGKPGSVTERPGHAPIEAVAAFGSATGRSRMEWNDSCFPGITEQGGKLRTTPPPPPPVAFPAPPSPHPHPFP